MNSTTTTEYIPYSWTLHRSSIAGMSERSAKRKAKKGRGVRRVRNSTGSAPERYCRASILPLAKLAILRINARAMCVRICKKIESALEGRAAVGSTRG